MRPVFHLWTFGLCAVLAGCVSSPRRANVEKGLRNDHAPPAQHRAVVEGYLIGCPDEIELRVADRSEFSGPRLVGPDGCIDLGDYGKIRVEGLSLQAAANRVAERIGSAPGQVQARVVEFESRQLILIGEVVGRHRTIPYEGSETVLQVLQRVGGITPGAEPTEVYVVRSHLGDLQRPEVFHVDLQAIVLKHDHATDVRVLPFDRIYVGETRQARIEKCIPPWLRPTYLTLWNMLPDERKPGEREPSLADWIRGWFESPEITATKADDPRPAP